MLILTVVASSIAFFVLTVRRRWLLQELRAPFISAWSSLLIA